MTNRELSQWLAEGNGEMRKDGVVSTYHVYWIGQENSRVDPDVMIRPWGVKEWTCVKED